MIFKPEEIIALAKRLKRGELAIFPCDTVWGIIGILNEDTVARAQKIKHRDTQKPLILLIPHLKMLPDYVAPLTDENIDQVKNYWPGATTLLFNKNKNVPDFVTSGHEKIGLRLPEFLPLNYLLLLLNQPLFSTSANYTGEPTPLTLDDVPQSLRQQVDMLYNRIPPKLHAASRIIDCTVSPPKMIRGNPIEANASVYNA